MVGRSVPRQSPTVNHSDGDFTVQQGKIVFGLTAIKGVGSGASEAIMRARAESGAYKDIFDFCERVDLKIVLDINPFCPYSSAGISKET